MNYTSALLLMYGFACLFSISATVVVVSFVPPYSRLPAAYTALGVHAFYFHRLLKEFRTPFLTNLLTNISGILFDGYLQNDIWVLDFCLLFYTTVLIFQLLDLAQNDNGPRWLIAFSLTARIWVAGASTALYLYFFF